MKAISGCMIGELVCLCKRVSHQALNKFLIISTLIMGLLRRLAAPQKASVSSGEATRLQQLEVQVLGESSTGFKNNGAAQQSPGVIAMLTSLLCFPVTSSLCLPSSGISLQ